MTAEQIRSIDMSHESDAARAAFALSMLQEIAAQLSELNERLSRMPEVLGEIGTVETLTESIRKAGSCVPYLYPRKEKTK